MHSAHSILHRVYVKAMKKTFGCMLIFTHMGGYNLAYSYIYKEHPLLDQQYHQPTTSHSADLLVRALRVLASCLCSLGIVFLRAKMEGKSRNIRKVVP